MQNDQINGSSLLLLVRDEVTEELGWNALELVVSDEPKLEGRETEAGLETLEISSFISSNSEKFSS